MMLTDVQVNIPSESDGEADQRPNQEQCLIRVLVVIFIIMVATQIFDYSR